VFETARGRVITGFVTGRGGPEGLWAVPNQEGGGGYGTETKEPTCPEALLLYLAKRDLDKGPGYGTGKERQR